MAPLPTVARRAAGLGVIPCAFVVAQFLLGQALRSPFLVNYMGLAAMPAAFAVCLWAGMRAATGASTWQDRLGAGLVAGGSVGLVAGLLDFVVVIGLLLAQVAFGLWVSPVPPLHASVERMAGSLLSAAMLLATVEGLLAAAALGAAIGAIGAALSAILPGRAGHTGQHPTAS